MRLIFPTIVAVGNELVGCLSETIKADNEVEIRDIFGRYVTDVIGTCVFGIQCNSLKDPNVLLRKMAKKRFEDEPLLSILKTLFAVTYSEVARFLGIRENNQEVIDFFTGIIGESFEYRVKNGVRRNDLMDLFIQSKKSKDLTMSEITAHAFTFFTGK